MKPLTRLLFAVFLFQTALRQCCGRVTTVTFCEGKTGRISCPKNRRISITQANYGRTAGREICPHSSIKTTSCRAASSLTKVQAACDMKPSCDLHASNSVFGDPCIGTYKYLQVSYECVPASAVTFCEGKTGRISCPQNMRIAITQANYGRTAGAATCPQAGMIKTTSCRAPSSLTKVRATCHMMSSCDLHASNSVFGDPCPGTYKYLQVSYECVPVPSIQILHVCENQQQSIVCRGNKKLDIMYGYYGRTAGGSICPHSQIHTTSCVSSFSIPKVQKHCQGRNACFLHASNAIYGDPCVCTHKYLEIRYRCVTNYY